MQQKVKDWEQYEGEKTQLLQYLKKAESELERPPETLAQDTAQKDFQSKKVSNIKTKCHTSPSTKLQKSKLILNSHS